jgi:hypothetical protein
MYPLREHLFDLRYGTARATGLRSVPGINRNDPHSSFFRFLCEDVEEGAPTRIVRGLRKPGAGDTLDVEGFADNEAVSVYQLSSLLVVEVPTLVRCLLVHAGDFLTGLAAAVRALLLSGERPLCSPKLLLSLPVTARRLNGLPARRDEEAPEPEVYPDRRAVCGDFGCISEVAREDRVPLAARLLDREGLDLALDRPVQLDLDVAYVLEVETPPAIFEPAPIAVGGELHEPETLTTLEAWVAGNFSCFNAPEERFERSVQPSQSSLRAREVGSSKVGVPLSGLLEPAGLLFVRSRLPFGLVYIAAFCEGRVVEAAVGLEHRVEGFGLTAVGNEPICERLPHPRRLYGQA